MNTKIPLLFVINNLSAGGSETLAAELSKGLMSGRFHPIVCGLGAEGPLVQKLDEYQIEHVALNKVDGKDFSLPGKLSKLIRERDIRVVHSHGQGPLLYMTMARFVGKKRYIFIHSEHINIDLEESNRMKAFWMNYLCAFALDGFVAISDHLAGYFENKFKPLKNKITTITNGVDIDKFTPEGESARLRSDLNLRDSDIIIGNISVLRDQKNHETMIKSMATVLKQYPNAKLVIAGGGPNMSAIESLITEFKLKDSVFLLGYRKDVPNLLRDFDIFCLSSLYEGLPLCLLEASAAGLPIVATDVQGNNEFIKNNETGLLVPERDPVKFGNAIVTLLSDKELALQLAVNAKKFVENHHSLKVNLKKYEGYYEKLLK